MRSPPFHSSPLQSLGRMNWAAGSFPNPAGLGLTASPQCTLAWPRSLFDPLRLPAAFALSQAAGSAEGWWAVLRTRGKEKTCGQAATRLQGHGAFLSPVGPEWAHVQPLFSMPQTAASAERASLKPPGSPGWPDFCSWNDPRALAHSHQHTQ